MNFIFKCINYFMSCIWYLSKAKNKSLKNRYLMGIFGLNIIIYPDKFDVF